MDLTDDARNFGWLLGHFVDETAGVTDAVAVSSDGILMARSASLTRDEGEHLCAIIAGCASMAEATDKALGGEGVERVIVAMNLGFLFVSAIADGSCIGVVATRDCDVGLVGYQTTELVERAGSLLTPSLRAELTRHAIPPPMLDPTGSLGVPGQPLASVSRRRIGRSGGPPTT